MGAKEQGADATHSRWIVIPRTLCFVFNGENVLLMQRAPHKRVFPNKYNGLGGHIERDEDPLTGARREILEESGLEVTDLRLRGVHNIHAGEVSGIMLFVFTAYSDTRDFVDDGREGTLHWVPISKLENTDLVEDLPLILPRILAMRDDVAPYFAHVTYDENDQIVMNFVEG
ncbi:MAG: NUDIX domain-containing protein [Anaerolineae bacterium]|nr:NUDIX domain-containing protein [Anaerolineae bacterium]